MEMQQCLQKRLVLPFAAGLQQVPVGCVQPEAGRSAALLSMRAALCGGAACAMQL